jgi:hypothetical protein
LPIAVGSVQVDSLDRVTRFDREKKRSSAHPRPRRRTEHVCAQATSTRVCLPGIARSEVEVRSQSDYRYCCLPVCVALLSIVMRTLPLTLVQFGTSHGQLCSV